MEQFVNDVNDRLGLSCPYNSSLTDSENIDNAYNYFKNDETISPWNVVLGAYILQGTIADYLDNLNKFLSVLIYGTNDIGIREKPHKLILQSLIPKLNISTVVTPAIEVERNLLIPVKADGTLETDENIKTTLILPEIELYLDSNGQFGFAENISISFPPSHPKAQIGKTGLKIGFQNMKLDLSRKKNIPEATADGRPIDFVGVYIQEASIEFPAFWNHNPTASTGVVKGRNLLIGTGGISGTLSLEAKTQGDPSPLIKVNFGDKFEASLTSFSLTFQQNAIIASNILGKIKVPGFKDALGNDAEIDIKIFIGQNGEFNITASEEDGIELKIPDVLTYLAKSIGFGRKDGKFYLQTSGTLDFDEQGAIGKFIQEPIDIEKFRIWQDGTFELEGGSIPLPKAVPLKIGPVKLTITAIHIGSHEQMHKGKLRKYKYFGFDGGINIKPGGVDARGEGVKFYFSQENNTLPDTDPAHRPLHVFVRIQGIGIDIIIPATASKETAAVILNGYLSMKNPSDTNTDPAAGTEYTGSVAFSLPKMKLAGSAAMRFNPSVPAFLIDIGLELPTPIPLGPTGLGIYGFRALLGQRYIADKTAANVPQSGSWYQYYKAKVSPTFREGVHVGKFNQKKGFTLGAGASVATTFDSGKVFSAKVFVMISLNPTLLYIQGQAAMLRQRIGLDSTNDPPFSAMIAIDEKSIEAAFGVNYKVPESSGFIFKLDALVELGFFFKNASAWYVNVGRDLPEEKRVQARILTLFNAYAYLMLSSSGIRAGAGAKWELV
ncbi:MAG: hypothetical protein K2X86_02965, partial [Cytophagaceae bacterium]|nr:hypothetical protein [Cytophagaceae bacterium]